MDNATHDIDLDKNSSNAGDLVATDAMGLPVSDSTSSDPRITMGNPDQTSHPGILDQMGDAASHITQSVTESVEHGVAVVGEVLSDVGHEIRDDIPKVYRGIKRVSGDLVDGVEGFLGFSTRQVLLLMGGTALIIYAAGKSKIFKDVHIL